MFVPDVLFFKTIVHYPTRWEYSKWYSVKARKQLVSDISRNVLIRLIPRSNLCICSLHTHNVKMYKILTLGKTSCVNVPWVVVLRELGAITDGLIGVSRLRVGRNREINCLLEHNLIIFCCFVGALNPDWGRAYLGCDWRCEVVCFRKLSFCSSLEISQNVGRVNHVVMLKHFVTSFGLSVLLYWQDTWGI